MVEKLREIVLGKPRNIKDPHIFHNVSLVAFLAWIGLGADGLSSSAYGPDEAFRALGAHTHLAIFLALLTAVTICVISVAYADLIEQFPGGGGGYLVATKLLGRNAGVVSGCALLVDYVLTISVSVASGCDAIWSFLPPHWAQHKLMAEFGVLAFLLILNLRGVKESVIFLAPIFLAFVATHSFLILYAVGSHLSGLPVIFTSAKLDFHNSVQSLGLAPILFVLMRAYSMGGGTYTGIEAVSNGVTMLREPRVQTAKRTMVLMAVSLAFTAGGILVGYMLTNSMPVPGKTMNAVLLENLFGHWPSGRVIVILTLLAEAILLFVAAQTGFLGGPGVLANMAVDSWMPHRFSQLSDRLVTKNGVYLMGLAAMGALFYTRGNITMLVVMYSINVFVTFALSELGMCRYWLKHRSDRRWRQRFVVQLIALLMCLSILAITVYEKFAEGGWVTLVITSAMIGLCFWIRGHYRSVRMSLARLDDILTAVPIPKTEKAPKCELSRNDHTAVLTVQRFSGFGLHQILSIQRLLPNYIKNFIFVSVGVVDSGNFKGANEIERLNQETRKQLEKYVHWCVANGLKADYRMAVGTEAVETLEQLCKDVAKEFPRTIVFTGRLIFQEEPWYMRFLHNETAYALQRRLQFDGIQTMVLPIRVL